MANEYLDSAGLSRVWSKIKALTNTLTGSISSLQSALTQKADKAAIAYAECDTAAGTAAKTVTITGFSYTKMKGGAIKIKFSNANTVDNATLSINGETAQPLFYNGARASSTNSWNATETVMVYYDGAKYMANNVAGAELKTTMDVSSPDNKKGLTESVIVDVVGDVHKDTSDNYISLQSQIDDIVAGDATVSLSVSPAVALADGTDKTFTFTASASKPATVVFNGGEPVSFTGSTPFTVILSSATPISTPYSASFTINGVSKGTKTANAQLAWKSSYGYGTGDYTTAVLTEVSQVKTSPAGEYTITIGTDASHIFFKVQSSMSITRVETVGGVSYAVAMDSPVTSDGWKYYRSTSTFDAGTYKFKVI